VQLRASLVFLKQPLVVNALLLCAVVAVGTLTSRALRQERTLPDQSAIERHDDAEKSAQRLVHRLVRLKSYEHIGEENLFNPARRPFPVPGTPGPTRPVTPTPTPQVRELKDFKFQLKGLIVFGNRFKKAFIESRLDGRTVESGYAKGDRIADFEVFAVTNEEVVLLRGKEAVTLKFDRWSDEGVFKSSYDDIIKTYQVTEGEKVYERVKAGGTVEHFTKADVTTPMGTAVKDAEMPLKYRPETLEEFEKKGELDQHLVISGFRMQTLPDHMRPAASREGEKRIISGAEVTVPPRPGTRPTPAMVSGYPVGERRRPPTTPGAPPTVSGSRR
jgi:hypothetical protein